MDEGTKQPVRRRRSKQERRRIVEESLQPGMSVARLARAHQVNANQVFHWRKLYREGLLADNEEKPAAQWLPVRLSDVTPEVSLEEPRQAQRVDACGAIEIDLPRGRVRIEGAAGAGVLRLVLELLRA
ncbi:MAG: transposase [Deltaproteobacteria bacterium]|jgi:transposase|nr:transposase [Deltaproteobacteria bacterium]